MPRRAARPYSPADLIRYAGLPVAAAVAIGLAHTAAGQDRAPAPDTIKVSAPAKPRLPGTTDPAPVSAPQGATGGGGGDGGGGGGDKPQVAVSEHMTVDLHVKDEDLASVLEMLAMQSQKNIITSKGVSGRVTASLYGVTFTEALDNILHPNGFGYIEQGNFIHVYTIEELVKIQESLKKRIAKVIYLNFINADDAKNLVEPLRSERGEVRVPKKTDAFVIPATAPVGKDDNALATCLVVIDYEDNVAAIEKLIVELDTRPAQVLVEATVLQVSLTEANAFGVDFSIIGDLNFTDFLNTGGPRSVADALTSGGTGAAGQGVSPADNQGTGISSLPGNTLNGPSSFKVGVIADDISIFLRALDEVTDTTIISNPKVLSLNRQPARVLVGRRVGYLKTTSSETSTVTEPAFLDTGTQLHFRPFVAKDGSIRMELKPQISEAIIRDATSAGGSVQTIPDLVTQEIVTNVIVRDGQSIVLGGLFRESSTLTRRQVPMLGDIPVVGAAFRGNDDTTQRSEIVFVITPSIVTDATVAEQANKAFDDAERVRAGNRQGLLMWSREKMTAALNVEAEQLAREGKYEEAMWKLNRSLSLNSGQPEAYRLREKISGEKETWPSRSTLDYVVGKEVAARLAEVPTPATPVKTTKPYGSHDIPKRPVQNPRRYPLSDATNGANPHNANGPADFQDPAAPNNLSAQARNGQTPTTVPAATSAAALEAQQLNLTATLTPSQVQPEQAQAGAQQFDPSADVKRELTDALLMNLESQRELYRAKNNGQFPILGAGNNDGWQTFIDQGYLRTVPKNPWIAGPNATRVVTGQGPDTTIHQNYGWIYNPQTGEFWAASIDATGHALASPDQQQQQAAKTKSAQPEDALTAANRARTVTLLTTIRSQIELFTASNNGQFPLLGAGEANGWQPLIDKRFLRTPPTNPWIDGPNSARVVMGRGPDAEFHTEYGWIYNPQTGQLWAAAVDEEGVALPHTTEPSNQGQPPVAGAEPERHSSAVTPGDALTPSDASGPAFATPGDAQFTQAASAQPTADVEPTPAASRARGFFRSLSRSFFSPVRSVPVPPGVNPANGAEAASAPVGDESP